MFELNSAGFQVLLDPAEVDALITARVNALSPAIVNQLAEDALVGAVPPAWWPSGGGSGGKVRAIHFAGPVSDFRSIGVNGSLGGLQGYVNILSKTITPAAADSVFYVDFCVNVGILALNITNLKIVRVQNSVTTELLPASTPTSAKSHLAFRAVSADALNPGAWFLEPDAPNTTGAFQYVLQGTVNQSKSIMGTRGYDDSADPWYSQVRSLGAAIRIFECAP
jgi:hypothetical protein